MNRTGVVVDDEFFFELTFRLAWEPDMEELNRVMLDEHLGARIVRADEEEVIVHVRPGWYVRSDW